MSETDRYSCKDAMERLWEFIDGELAEPDARCVEAHLEACKGCYPQYDFQRAFCAFLRQHATKPVPSNLRRRVFMALLEEDRRQHAGGSPEPGC